MTWLAMMTWFMSACTITSVYLTGNKNVAGWYLGIFNQGMWAIYIAVTHTWGFIPTGIFLLILHVRNARKWNREIATYAVK